MINSQGRTLASQKKPFQRIQELNAVQMQQYFGYNDSLRLHNWKGLNLDSIDARAKIWIIAEWDREQKQGLSYHSLGDGLFVFHNETLGDYTKSLIAEYRTVKIYKNAKRIIRGGTWQSSDFNRREPMSPDSAAMGVGFRCVMPYISTPVKKEYKVKW